MTISFIRFVMDSVESSLILPSSCNRTTR